MTRTQRFTLIAAILGSTVVFLDSTIVNVALPAIADDLDAGLAGQQWVVEAYMLALVSLLLVGGALGDQKGRRLMFVAGLAGFGVTSVLCAIAPTDEVLVGARALQGIAGALLVPGSLALVAAAFDGAARGAAVGTWTAWTGISTIVGPAGGGFLVDALDWRWIFWINLPLVAATILLTLRHVEESKDPEAVPGIDWVGIALSAIGLGGPVFALIEQPIYGWTDPIVLVPLILGIVCFALFIAWERRAPHPMLELGLFRVRNFAVANLATFASYAGLIGGFFFITLFLQQTAGYSALEAGLATTPVSVLMFVLSSRFGRFASGTGPRLPMAAGAILGGIGMLLFARVGADADYISDVLPAVFVFGLGLAALVAPLTATVLDSVEERHSGVASGINNGISRVAGLLAIAVLGAVIAAQFKGTIDDNLAGTELGPAAERSVAEAREKPLGAAETGGLDPQEASTVTTAVTDASESSFDLGIGICGVLMICGGVVAAVGIRNPERPRPAPETEPRATALAGECGRCPEDPAGAGRRGARKRARCRTRLRSMRPVLSLACLCVLMGCGSEEQSRPSPPESSGSARPTASKDRPDLREARCPPAAANCESATGRVIYVEAVDPDGDGDAHFVLEGDESVTGAGISVIDVRRDLRPRPLPGAGDLVSASGPVYRGSYGQRQIQAEVFGVAP